MTSALECAQPIFGGSEIRQVRKLRVDRRADSDDFSRDPRIGGGRVKIQNESGASPRSPAEFGVGSRGESVRKVRGCISPGVRKCSCRFYDTIPVDLAHLVAAEVTAENSLVKNSLPTTHPPHGGKPARRGGFPRYATPCWGTSLG